ncbi:malto-oligosyltrehalose trehalohydrolase [Arthrobacter agilis]|uniref:malto-oligosyltrehalose trehalohydrolase n=1 Tax=Arthrobacter agilis TaxID=37921 RepID=UPI000B34CC3F|nr:malto-oligosyltrehalose trehalohydrolase [Arthrobacter agilis]OUM41510.1 malto-oligosyltrehalose trehalohydrolase [Arthrobacter agilis]PPB47322.1 malto-oligosyltrehalose trehalohydrolase [Arthrobacter agilis]TPV26913.1 malto-oligosyltrehalose trehalohydrolase [Arthrobacter agilis]VDR32960.1 Malto-oligosyltrehalose trehalohydrolase [Arthrobacter agilis]
MNTFDVWAPRATTLTLVVEGEQFPMTQGDGGWWQPAGTPASADDVSYGYLVDDSETPVPDPRSRRQPEGVHELSRTFDPTAHAWQDSAWQSPGMNGGVIYEMHLGTFTPEGTLDAAIGKLDHLVDLGVQYVELLPVNAFNGTHNWGYDGVLWYAVQETYGGPAAYQRFVDAAHQRGLGVIQDVVYNHLGPSGNYLGLFGPYLTEGMSNTWGDSLNLDGPQSDEVRDYVVENLLMWFTDYHVDGLRLDAVHALHDERAVHILEEFGRRTDACAEELGKPLFLIAESDLNNPRLIQPREVGGYGLAGQWSDDFHHAVHVNLTRETEGYYLDFDSVGALAKVLEKGFYHNGSYSSFRERHHGREIDPALVSPLQLVVCTQNHDQIGNRAAGDRLSATLNPAQLAQAAVLNILGPFTPMLFMGEEYGASTPWPFFTSHPEPELGKATAEGRLKEFERMGWRPEDVPNPQDPATFASAKLDWEEAQQGHHAELLTTYRDLIRLRRDRPELRDADFAGISVDFDEDGRWIVLHRGRTAVLLNLGERQVTVPVRGADAEVLLSTVDGVGLLAESVQLPAHASLVLGLAPR